MPIIEYIAMAARRADEPVGSVSRWVDCSCYSTIFSTAFGVTVFGDDGL
jgi:hypothetical protein